MVAWSRSRLAATILLFTTPAILAILAFSVFPILLSSYISFTNRNAFHPNPDCNVALTGILDPVCWPQFRANAPKGLGEPYTLVDPIYKNYADLFAGLFSAEALWALGRIVISLLPLIGAYYLNKRWDKGLERPVSAGVVWGAGLLGVVLVALVVNLGGAYNDLTNTGDFIVVVLRTILFVLIRVPLTFVIGLVLALILNQPELPGKTFFRVVLFVPWAASSLAILMAKVWEFFFREQGTLNQLLRVFDIQGIAWLQNPISAFGAIVLADVWFSYPFFMIAILGGLQSITADQYEAAEVDGATWWDKLTAITLPNLRPVILPAIVLTSITAFQMFGTAYAMTQGGPSAGAGKPGATEFVIVYAFRQIFQTQNYGRATAFAVIIFIFLFLVTVWSLRYTRITKGAYE